MGGYGFVERRVARLLDRVPRFKRGLKLLYQVGNYFIFGERGFRYALNPGLSCSSISTPTTQGEAFFGYYDKSPWEPGMRQFAWHQINADGTLSVMVRQANRIKEIARTLAWSWQQGAMTQWVTAAGQTRLVFNDLIDDCLVSCWYGDKPKDVKIFPWPVQAVAPSGDFFISLNFLRLQRLRPDYGYNVDAKNLSPQMADEEDGLWGIAYDSGDVQLLISLKQLKALTPEAADAIDHKVNHVMFSPSGKRFIFVYRWFGRQGKKSRLFLYDRPTASLRLLLDGGMVSHYCWLNERELIAYCRTNSRDGYYRVDADTGKAVSFASGQLDRYGDGHPSVSPCGRFLITDTYPDRKRQQRLLLYRFDDDVLTEVGRFFLPLRFSDVHRIDLHPRWSPDGSKISIDSGHDGRRFTYTIDMSPLLEL